jgi:hypothetical protein
MLLDGLHKRQKPAHSLLEQPPLPVGQAEFLSAPQSQAVLHYSLGVIAFVIGYS